MKNGALLVLVGLTIVVASVRTQESAPAPEDIAAGQRIYRQKADCQSCHGWAAVPHVLRSYTAQHCTGRCERYHG